MNNKIETFEGVDQIPVGILSGKYSGRGIEPRTFSGPMLSPLELATLAATLPSQSTDSPEKLCMTALNLWKTSSETVALQNQCYKDHEVFQRIITAAKTRPLVTLEDYLKAKLPTIDTPSLRQKRFHQFLVEGFQLIGMTGRPEDGGVNNFATLYIDQLKKTGLPMASYPGFDDWHKEKVRASKSANANKMHDKRREKNAEIEQTTAAKKAARKTSPHLSRTDPEIELDKKSYDDWLAQENSQQ